jgi:hypothetical protein
MPLVLIALVAGVLAFGQTPADLYAYEEYQAWAAKQKPGEDLLDRYKAYLIAGGADSVDAESQVRTVLRLAGAEAAHPFVVEMVRGRKAGKALEVAKGGGRNGEWLAREGWTVTAMDVSKANKSPFAAGSWDLIVVNGLPLGEQEAAVIESLRPGGRLIITGLKRGAAPRGLRVAKVSETEGLYCGEKAP